MENLFIELLNVIGAKETNWGTCGVVGTSSAKANEVLSTIAKASTAEG